MLTWKTVDPKAIYPLERYYAVSGNHEYRIFYGLKAAYRDYRDRYREMATSLGFEGHMQWAEAMP